jgi:site-specific recombinase XerD
VAAAPVVHNLRAPHTKAFSDLRRADEVLDIHASSHPCHCTPRRSQTLCVRYYALRIMIRTMGTRPPANKGKTYPPEVLTPDEVRALIATCSDRSSIGIRNRALIVLMYRTGLRHSEALDLYPKDVDRQHGSVRVLHGKGDRARTVGIDQGAFAVIDAWIIRRQELGFGPQVPLFCSLQGTRMKTSYLRGLLPRLAIQAGIDKRVHPHGLRHTHAHELAMEEVPITIIQRQLGHISLATTDRYLNHIAPKQVIDRIGEREWQL